MQESHHLTASHDTMNLLAENTGGKAYYNRNDIDGAIRDGMNDGSTYYMLGYYPENKTWDGKFRKLQIKVGRAGVKLRHRLGYYAAEPQAIISTNPKQRARDLANALTLDRPLSTGLFFEAAVMPPSSARCAASWFVSPSASGSENGTPSSRMSVPLAKSARQTASDVSKSGSPAYSAFIVFSATSFSKPCFPRTRASQQTPMPPSAILRPTA